jgi:hypothetical protein
MIEETTVPAGDADGLVIPQLKMPSMRVIFKRLDQKVDQKFFHYLPCVSRGLENIRHFSNPDLQPYLNGMLRITHKKDVNAVASALPEGTILYMVDSGAVRGISPCTLKAHHLNGYLKNHVTVVICMERNGKMLPFHANIAEQTIHMCGTKDETEATKLFNLVLDHLKALQTRLDYIAALPEAQRDLTFKIATETHKGPRVSAYYQELVHAVYQHKNWKQASRQRKDDTRIDIEIFHRHQKWRNIKLPVRLSSIKWLKQRHDVFIVNKRKGPTTVYYERPMKEIADRNQYHMILPQINRIELDHTAPLLPDQQLYDTMCCNMTDFDAWEGWVRSCEVLMQTTFCCALDNRMSLNGDRDALANCNLQLPLPVRLKDLVFFFRDRGIMPFYNNEAHDYATIFFPYQKDNTIRRKTEDDAVRVMVFPSGKTIFTGPSKKFNEIAYEVFVRHIFDFYVLQGEKMKPLNAS